MNRLAPIRFTQAYPLFAVPVGPGTYWLVHQPLGSVPGWPAGGCAATNPSIPSFLDPSRCGYPSLRIGP